jgi:phosphoglycerate dehydrogenase-like enzyme
MIKVLIVMTLPEPIRRQYADRLRAAFPQLKLDVVDHRSKADPYIGAADVLLTYGSMIDDAVLQKAVNLKWIHAFTAGTDGIDDLPSLRREVLLTSTRGIHGAPVSEAALMAMLALSRGFARTVHHQAERIWERQHVTLLDGKTVGIFGIGAIGTVLAAKCKAMGMRVLGVDRLRRQAEALDRMLGWDEGVQALGEMDYVVLLLPSSHETLRIVGAQFLGAMKPSGYLVNLGRGDVVDEQALIDALRRGRIAGASLDVFAREPLPAEHPFWSLPNVIVTPHLGGVFDEYPERAWPIIEGNLRRFLAGDYAGMVNLVDH